IQRVRPGMIRTLQRLPEPSFCVLAQSRPAVPADVIKCAGFARLVPQNNQALTRDISQEVVAALSNFTLMSNAQPMIRKDSRLFQLKYFGRDQEALWQGFGAGGKSLARFSKFTHAVSILAGASACSAFCFQFLPSQPDHGLKQL